MAEKLRECVDPHQYAIYRKVPFFAHVTLERVAKDADGTGGIEVYVFERNRRNRFSVGVGTRPFQVGGKRGTLLLFAVGSENAEGYSASSSGVFIPEENTRAAVSWKDHADGTLAVIDVQGVQYRLRLTELQALPEDAKTHDSAEPRPSTQRDSS